MKTNIWIYKDRRTSPGRIHRVLPETEIFDVDGKKIPQPLTVVAVVELLLEAATDGREGILHQKVEAVHLPENFKETDQWGPNGEWLGGRGIQFIFEDEYPDEDPHELFRAHEAIRSAGPPVEPGRVTKMVDPVTGEVIDAVVAPDGSVANQATGEIIQPPSGAPPRTGQTPPADSDHLPDGFPGKAALEAAGKGTFGKVRKLVSNNKLEEVEGIGTVTAQAIERALAELGG